MGPDDAGDDVEQGLALPAPGRGQVGLDAGDVGRVAGGELVFDEADRFRPAEPLRGDRGVVPAQDEAAVRGAESPAQDVVEGVQVPSPGGDAERAGDRGEEAVQVVEG
jgi:hypothetical protein